MTTTPTRVAFIGFGEAASAFVEGWAEARSAHIGAYDVKTDSIDNAVREAKRSDYARWRVAGAASLAEALGGIDTIFSLVTADQALTAARQAAACLTPGALFFDCNSCSPGTKRQSAQAIEAAGGRYVDVAVMAPVHPALHRVPLLVSGPHIDAAQERLTALGMNAKPAAGAVGKASSIKMVRSIMIKGLEALVAECTLAGRRAGVDGEVLASLEASFPDFGWESRSAYMLERSMTHGIRRAAEMREVELTIEELGLPPNMTHGTVAWQQSIGDLHLSVPEDDYRKRADAILAALPKHESTT